VSTSGEDDTRTFGQVRPSTAWTSLGFRLTVLDGPSQGASVEIGPDFGAGPWILGRKSDCALVLADKLVSSRHASVEVTSWGPRIVDLGSRNGTFVNGVAVVDAFLGHGDTVKVGEHLIAVHALAADAPASSLPDPAPFGSFASASPEIARLRPLFDKLSASDVPVVVTGETGTGKEVLARSIHAASKRAAQRFVVFDCTATTPSLIEAALFGHEKGAFTGAVSSARGVFEEADRGTLLIDEIGDLDLPLQAKLLRAIERGEIRRVGGNRWIEVDVRILAATRRDLRALVRDGKFRDDLYYRLAVARCELPPLRGRTGDVAYLTRKFWVELGGDASSLSPALLAAFEKKSWPGNVRELRNAVARSLALGELAEETAEAEERGEAGLEPLVTIVDEVVAEGLPLKDAREKVLAEFERRYLERALRAADGNLGKAAEMSGVAERYFRLLRARHGMTKG
jgi:DNA-binding NtrC family response regulator